jgi:hypothetical protein
MTHIHFLGNKAYSARIRKDGWFCIVGAVVSTILQMNWGVRCGEMYITFTTNERQRPDVLTWS